MNQHQRRERTRRAQRLQAFSYLIAFALFAAAYLILRPSIQSHLYQQIIDSAGSLTYDQAASALLAQWWVVLFVGYFFVFLCVLLILNLVTRRKPSRFDFGGERPPTETAAGYHPDLMQITPREFERYVAWLVNQQTGYQTRVIGGAGDSGVDVEVFDGDQRLIGVVQCKRYDPAKALPPGFIRELATVRDMRKVQIAYMATTAYYTRETQQLAKSLNVRLIDGRDLEHARSSK